MSAPPTVETERLLLRPFTEADLDRYFEVHSTPEVRAALHIPASLNREAGTHRPERADWPGLECGWCFDPAHWGRGYATEAGRATVDWAFASHADDRLVSVILPENTASQAVADRLGFTLREERTLKFFPTMPHGIWVLPRPQ